MCLTGTFIFFSFLTWICLMAGCLFVLPGGVSFVTVMHGTRHIYAYARARIVTRNCNLGTRNTSHIHVCARKRWRGNFTSVALKHELLQS